MQNMGYKVSLKGDKIKLKFIGKDDPPKQALTIINAIKENKALTIGYLSNISRMDDIFGNAVNEISKAYTRNALSYTQKVFPLMYEKAMDIENSINRLWDGGKDLKTFQEAVKEWQEIQMKFIKLLNAKKGVEAVKDTVYNSPNGKPDPSQGLGKEANDNGTL